jgi:inner membrane protein
MAVLPFLLTGLMLAWDRVSHRMRRAVIPSEARAGPLLLISFVAILSHPVLDTLNTYGVRWLMPWNRDWSYGDTLFIVDPWMWLILGTGVLLSRRRRRARERNLVPEVPARRALALAVAYAAVMLGLNVATRRSALRAVTALHPGPVRSMMAGPVFANPFVRQIVIEQDSAYRVTSFDWLSRPHIAPADVETYPLGPPADPVVPGAVRTVEARRFLGWARFPHVSVDSGGSSRVVHIVDLRYARRPGVRFGSVSVPVPPSGP